MPHETPQTSSVEKISKDEYRILTSILIEAPVEEVWAALTDWDRLPDWSSSFIGLEGDFEADGHVVVTFKILGTTQHPEHDLIDFEEGIQFAWSDPVVFGMVDHHLFRVEAVDAARSRFIQNDRLTGGATWVLGGLLAGRLCSMYQDFNHELKTEVERRQSNQAD